MHLGFTESMIELGLLALNRVTELAEADTLLLVSSCSGSGDVTIRNFDGDGSGDISDGDLVTLTFSDTCYENLLRTDVRGGIRVQIDQAFAGRFSDVIFKGRLTLGPDLAIEAADPSTGLVFDIGVEGSMAFEMATGGRPYSIEAVRQWITAGDSIVITIANQTPPVVEYVTAFEMTRRILTTGQNALTLDYTMQVDSGSLGGIVTCETEQTLSGGFLSPPTSGQIRCNGAASTAVRLNSDRAAQADPVTAEIDATGDGSFASLDLGALSDWENLVEGSLYLEDLYDLPRATDPVIEQVPQVVYTGSVVDIVYNPLNDRLYVSGLSSITELDPGTLQVSRTIDTASFPSSLALSDDGTVLWYGYALDNRLDSVTTADLQPGPGFSMGDSPNPDESDRWARDILVAPGTTDLLVVSTRSSEEVIVFDAGAELPDSLAEPERRIVFRDATTIIGADHDPGSTAYVIDFDAAQGVTVVEEFGGLWPGFQSAPVLGNRDILSTGGSIFSVESGTARGRLETDGRLRGNTQAAVDLDNRLIYGISHDAENIHIYNEDDYTRIGHYAFVPEQSGIFDQELIITDDDLVFAMTESITRFALADLIPNLSPVRCRFVDLSDLIRDGEYKTLRCPITGIAYDAVRELYYVGLAGGTGPNGNSIAVLDAGTLEALEYIPVTITPDRLRISDDGQTLHAVLDDTSLVVAIDLDNRTVNEIALGSDGLALYQAETVAQSPVNQQDLIVSTTSGRLGLYRAGVPVGAIADPGETYQNIDFDPADPLIVYGHAPGVLDTFSVDGTGVTQISSESGVLAGPDVVRSGSVLYSSAGDYYDLSTSESGVACNFELPPESEAIAVDHASSTLYFLTTEFRSNELYRCDIGTGEVAGPFRLSFFGKESLVGAPLFDVLSPGRLLLVNRGQAVIFAAP